MVSKFRFDKNSHIPEAMHDALRSLWTDGGVKSCLERGQLQITESVK